MLKSIKHPVTTYLKRGFRYIVSGSKAAFRIPLTTSLTASPSLDYTFTRSTAGTYIDSNGVIQTADINEPRFQDGGLLVEPAATNLFINSSTPVTQNITVTSGTSYTVWGTGAGSIVLSGAGAGTVTATAPITFTASTSTLTCTVTNMSTVQVESGTAPTSYIPTAGAATTRTADVLIYNVSDVITQGQGSLYLEFTFTYIEQAYIFELSDNTVSNRIRFIFYDNRIRGIVAKDNINSLDTYIDFVAGLNKICMTYINNTVAMYINGTFLFLSPDHIIPTNLSTLAIGTRFDSKYTSNAVFKNFKYFSEPLSKAEAMRLTS